MTPVDVEPGVPGDVGRQGPRANLRIAARLRSAETLQALRRLLSLAVVMVYMVVPLATVGASALRTAAHTVALDVQHAVQAAWVVARRRSAATLRVLRIFLSLALVAVNVMAAAATIGSIGLQASLDEAISDPHSGARATAAAAAARREASASEPPQALRVHVQTQAFLRTEGQQQFRLAVDDGSLGRSHGATVGSTLLMVDLTIHPQPSDDAFVSVTPTRLVVTRHELGSIPIWIEVADGVACDADLGELQVRVRELVAEGLQGTTTVILPPVDCREGPPPIGLREQ